MTPPKQALNPNLEKLLSQGIPVSKVEFNAAVNNACDVPEYHFNEISDNKNRRVQMWLTPAGLLCLQKDIKGDDKYFLVPNTFKYCHFKQETFVPREPIKTMINTVKHEH